MTSALFSPFSLRNLTLANRIVVSPMCQYSAEHGSATDWHLMHLGQFAMGAAALVMTESTAVSAEGRISHKCLGLYSDDNEAALGRVIDFCRRHGVTALGIQLAHAGRKASTHPPGGGKPLGADQGAWTALAPSAVPFAPDWHVPEAVDAEAMARTKGEFAAAATRAARIGFDLVELHCAHGYLLHEFLSARPREGKFGGDFEGRTRLLRTIVGRVQDTYPDLTVVVRLSIFDMPPFKTSRQVGEPMDYSKLLPYDLGFGVNADQPMEADLDEPLQLIGELQNLGVAAINLSAGSPYYNPHMQRPAIFPPSDGYLPPEDPLVGVVRQIQAARRCQEAFPDMPMVGTGYSYLQDYLPHVAQAVVRRGWIDIVGLGRMVLSYPELPADTLAGRELRRKLVCRTFSDCTTAPRNGLVSGCFPLDSHYKSLPEAAKLRELKQDLK